MAMNRRRPMGGFTLIEMLVALIIGMTVLAAGSAAMIEYYQNQALTAAAQHLQRVAIGVSEYIADNNAAIVAATDATTPYVIDGADLTGGGYLPAGFNTVNGFGQDIEARVVQPAADVLEAVVFTTGGDTLTGLDSIKAAHLMGAPGGFIPPDDTDVVRGSFGGWQMDLSTYGINPGAGRLAFALFMASATASGIAAAEDAPTVAQYIEATTYVSYSSGGGPGGQGSVAYCPNGWIRKRGGYRQVVSYTITPMPPATSEPFYGDYGWRVADVPFGHGAYYAWVECVPE